MGFVRYLFLRFYGFNMERRYRNAPEQACGDAILSTITFLTVTGATLLIGFIAILVPQAAQIHYQGIKWGAVASVVLALFFLTRPLKQYVITPEVAIKFRSRANVRLTLLTLFGLPALCIAPLSLALK
jgi:hypothetical protein